MKDLKQIQADVDFDVDEYELKLRKKYKNAGFTDAEINKHLNTLDSESEIIGTDDLIIDTEAIPEERLDEGDLLLRQKINKEEYLLKKEYRNQEIANIFNVDARIQEKARIQNNDKSSGTNPHLSTVIGDKEDLYNPFSTLLKDGETIQEYAKIAEDLKTQRQVQKMGLKYLDNGPLHNYDLSKVEKVNLLDTASTIFSLASNSKNIHSTDGKRKGFLQLTDNQWEDWKQLYAATERKNGTFIYEEWLDESDPTAVLAQNKHAIILINYIMHSPNISEELRAGLLNGDIESAQKFVDLHIYMGEENKSQVRKEGLLTDNYEITSGDLGFINPQSTIGKISKALPGGKELVKFLGGYGVENIFSNGFDSSVNGAIALFNEYQLRDDVININNLKQITDEKYLKEPGLMPAFIKTMRDLFFVKDLDTPSEKKRKLAETLNYDNMSTYMGFAKDVITFANDLPYFAAGEKIRPLRAANQVFKSTVGSGFAFYIPTVMRSSLYNAILDNKVDNFGNFLEHLLSYDVQKSGLKAFSVGGLLGLGRAKFINRPMDIRFVRNSDKTNAFPSTRLKQGRLLDTRKYNYNPMTNKLQGHLANLAWDTVGLGTLSPIIQEGRLPVGSDYAHAAAIGGVLRGKDLFFGGKMKPEHHAVDQKIKKNAFNLDPNKIIEADVLATQQVRNGIIPVMYDRFDSAIRNAFKKRNVDVINEPVYRPNDKITTRIGQEEYRHLNTIDENGVKINLVEDPYNYLKVELAKDMNKGKGSTTEIVEDQFGNISPVYTTKSENNYEMPTQNRYVQEKEKIDDIEYKPNTEESLQMVKVGDKYNPVIRKPSLTEKGIAVRKRNIFREIKNENDRIKIRPLKTVIYPALTNIILEYNRGNILEDIGWLNDYIPKKGDAGYEIFESQKKEGAIVGGFTGENNLMYHGYAATPVIKFVPDFQTHLKQSEEQDGMGDYKNNPYIAFAIKHPRERTDEEDIYVFNKSAYDMLRLYDFRAEGELEAASVRFVYKKNFVPDKGLGPQNPEYLNQPKDKHGALMFFTPNGKLLSALEPLPVNSHIYRGLEKQYKNMNKKKNEKPIIDRYNSFVESNDFLNPMTISPKSGKEIRDKLFYGTGLTMQDMLLMMEKIGVEVEFVTKEQMKKKYNASGALGFTAPPEFFNKEISAKGMKQEGNIKIILLDKFKNDPSLVIELEQLFAHEMMHVIDYYDKQWSELTKPRERGQTENYEGYAAALSRKFGGNRFVGRMLGTDFSGGEADSRVPGNFNFREFMEAMEQSESVADTFRIGRGNVLGALATYKDFGEEFFDATKNEPMSLATYKKRIKEMELEAKSRQKEIEEKYKKVFETDKVPRTIKNNKILLPVLEEFLPIQIYEDLLNFSHPLRLQMITNAVSSLPKDYKKIFDPQSFDDVVGPTVYKDYGRAFAQAIENEFALNGIISLHVVYREMAYISNQFRPTSEEALDYRAAWINQFEGTSLEDYGYANTIKYIKEMYQKADMVFPSLQRRLEYTPAEYKKHRKEIKAVLDAPTSRLSENGVKNMLGEYDFYFSRVSGYYRNTKEMFADWGMAFILYPEFTKVHSPVATKFFLEHLDKKPEFAKTYNYIQAAINKTPGESTGREGQLFNDMFDAIKRKQKEVEVAKEEGDVKDPFEYKTKYFDQHSMLTSYLDATGGRPQEFSSAILKGEATKEVRKNQHLDFTQNPELTKEDDIMWQIGQLQLKSTEFEKFSDQLFPVMQALQEAMIKYPEMREDTDAFLTTVGLYHIVAKGGSREEVAQNPLFLRGKELFKNMHPIQYRDKDGKPYGDPISVIEFLDKRPMAEDMIKYIDKTYPEVNAAIEEFFSVTRDALVNSLAYSGLVDIATLKKIKNNKWLTITYGDRMIERLRVTGREGFKGTGFEAIKGSIKTPAASFYETIEKTINIISVAKNNTFLNYLARKTPFDLKGYKRLLESEGLLDDTSRANQAVSFDLWQDQVGFLRTSKELLESFFPGVMGTTIGANVFKTETLEDGTVTLAKNKNLQGRIIIDVEDKKHKKVSPKVQEQIKKLRKLIKELTRAGNTKVMNEMRKELFYLQKNNLEIDKNKIPKNMEYVKFKELQNESLTGAVNLLTNESLPEVDLGIAAGSVKYTEVFIHKALVAALFDKEATAIGNIAFLRSFAAGIQWGKDLYVGYNPIYALRNPPRDAYDIAIKSGANLVNILDKNALKNVQNYLKRVSGKPFEKMSKQDQVLGYTKYIIEEYKDAWRVVRNPQIIEAENKEFYKRINMMPKANVGKAADIFKLTDYNQGMFNIYEKLSLQDGVNYHAEPEVAGRKYILPQINKLAYEIYALTKAGELAPRAAFWQYYQDGVKDGLYPKVDPKKLDIEIQRVITPNYAARGTYAAYLELTMPFFNATVQSYRADIRAFQRNPQQYLLRTVQYNKWEIIKNLAKYGVLGGSIAMMFRGVDPVDEALYHNLPLFLMGEDDDDYKSKKVFYLKLPKSPTAILHNYFVDSAMHEILSAAGYDYYDDPTFPRTLTNERKNAARLEYLKPNASFVLEAMIDTMNFLVDGTLPKSNLTDNYLVTDDIAYLSKKSRNKTNDLYYSMFGPTGDKYERQFFIDDFAKSMYNKYGLGSPIGHQFDLGRNMGFSNLKEKLRKKGLGALNSFYGIGPELGEMAIDQFKENKQMIKVLDRQLVDSYFNKAERGETPTEQEMNAVNTMVKRQGIDAIFKWCRTSGLNCTRASLKYLQLPKKEREYIDKNYFNKYMFNNTGRMTNTEKDAMDKVQNEINKGGVRLQVDVEGAETVDKGGVKLQIDVEGAEKVEKE